MAKLWQKNSRRYLVIVQYHFDGMHIAILNSKALSVAGKTGDIPAHVKRSGIVAHVDKDPETGEPTGIIREGLKILPLPFSAYHSSNTLPGKQPHCLAH